MEKLVDIGIVRGYAKRVIPTTSPVERGESTIGCAVAETGLPKLSEPISSCAEVCP